MPITRSTPAGVLVVGALAHRGEARHLVHRLKYYADLGAGRVLADLMRPLVADAPCLVPVPRAMARRLRFGIDPARWLSERLSVLTGVAVANALVPGIWWPRRAGATDRTRPVLTRRGPVGPDAVLVDDVVTTGATIDTAARLLGSTAALAATVVPGP